MKRNDLEQLTRVTSALYLRERNAAQPVLKREAEFCSRLAALERNAQAARVQSGDRHLQAIGADVAWQAWESRMRRELNTELARARVEKLAALDSLRAAFGRDRAIRDLMLRQKAAQRSKQDKLQLQRLLG